MSQLILIRKNHSKKFIKRTVLSDHLLCEDSYFNTCYIAKSKPLINNRCFNKRSEFADFCESGELISGICYVNSSEPNFSNGPFQISEEAAFAACGDLLKTDESYQDSPNKVFFDQILLPLSKLSKGIHTKKHFQWLLYRSHRSFVCSALLHISGEIDMLRPNLFINKLDYLIADFKTNRLKSYNKPYKKSSEDEKKSLTSFQI